LGLRPEVGPRQYGFDTTYGYLHGQIDPYTHLYKIGDRSWHRNDEFFDEQGHATDLLAAAAVKYVETPRNEPFFMYLCFSVPHTPLNEPEKWTKPYDGKITDRTRKLFAASVTHMDDAIGQLLSALDRTGKRKDTLIVFTSDNGGQKDEPASSNYSGSYGKYETLGNNQPLRGWKGDCYEGGVRVPALVSWPGVLEPRTVDAVAGAFDLLPSIAALVGASVPADAHLDGANVWPAFEGKPVEASRPFYWKTGKELAVRVGPWKLIAAAKKDQEAAQLFNLVDDPLEKQDQAAAHPEIVARLRHALGEQQALDK
jgi:arylsulfatase A-like enzyme